MAENPEPSIKNVGNGTGVDPDQSSVPLGIGAQYIKDLSFENPRGIETLSAIQNNPDVNVDVSTNARSVGEEGMFEVSVFIRAEATVDDAPVFIVELTYSGIIQVSNVPEEDDKADCTN